MNTPRFSLGKIVATPGASQALGASGQSPLGVLTRHLLLEKGELDAHDHRQNLRALKDGSRIFSSFKTSKGEAIWVISEGRGDDGERHSTCLLLLEEY